MRQGRLACNMEQLARFGGGVAVWLSLFFFLRALGMRNQNEKWRIMKPGDFVRERRRENGRGRKRERIRMLERREEGRKEERG